MSETTALAAIQTAIGTAYHVHCADHHGALYGPGQLIRQVGCRQCDALWAAMQAAATPVPPQTSVVPAPAAPHRR